MEGLLLGGFKCNKVPTKDALAIVASIHALKATTKSAKLDFGHAMGPTMIEVAEEVSARRCRWNPSKPHHCLEPQVGACAEQVGLCAYRYI
jgi:hypothetical protein